MHTSETFAYLFSSIRDRVHATVADLDPGALRWRPDERANPIGWLLWHLTRIEDDHLAGIRGGGQVWSDASWPARFGLRATNTDTGYGHTSGQVDAVRPADAAAVRDYHDAVADALVGFLAGTTDDDLDRIVDRSYDPPVTLGVRLSSMAMDALQHVGQAAYVRGLYERRGGGSRPGA